MPAFRFIGRYGLAYPGGDPCRPVRPETQTHQALYHTRHIVRVSFAIVFVYFGVCLRLSPWRGRKAPGTGEKTANVAAPRPWMPVPVSEHEDKPARA